MGERHVTLAHTLTMPPHPLTTPPHPLNQTQASHSPTCFQPHFSYSPTPLNPTSLQNIQKVPNRMMRADWHVCRTSDRVMTDSLVFRGGRDSMCSSTGSTPRLGEESTSHVTLILTRWWRELTSEQAVRPL